jgi:hypothetical protein
LPLTSAFLALGWALAAERPSPRDLIRAGFALERLEEPLDGSANGVLFSEVPMVLVIAGRAI